MYEAEDPTEARMRQGAKPTHFELFATPRKGTDRLYQQYIGKPSVDDLASDAIALDLLVHQPKNHCHRSGAGCCSRNEQEIRQHVEQEARISGIKRDGTSNRNRLVTPQAHNIVAGVVEGLTIERRHLRIAGYRICRVSQQADIACAHQLGRARRQHHPTGPAQHRHKLEPV